MPVGGRVRDQFGGNVALAPVRFSITNGCPSRSDNHWLIRRATMSLAPPGGKPTITRTGRDGKALVLPIWAFAGIAARHATKSRRLRCGKRMA